MDHPNFANLNRYFSANPKHPRNRDVSFCRALQALFEERGRQQYLLERTV